MIEWYEEIEGDVLCRLYYEFKPQFSIYKVYAPFDKSVYYVKSVDELHNICEKLFRVGYFQGKHEKVFTTKVTSSIFARSVVYWLSRTGTKSHRVDEVVRKETVTQYLFPLLERCSCSNSTKERYLIELGKYLAGDEDLKSLLTYFSLHIIKLKKGYHLHKSFIA